MFSMRRTNPGRISDAVCIFRASRIHRGDSVKQLGQNDFEPLPHVLPRDRWAGMGRRRNAGLGFGPGIFPGIWRRYAGEQLCNINAQRVGNPLERLEIR